MAGIRTELAIQEASACPVARASEAVEGPMIDITWTDDNGESVIEQFTAATNESFDGFDPVFDYGSRQVYEFERDHDELCICSFIQQSLGPLTSVHASDGDLHVTIHASDVGELREVVRQLREEYGTVNVEYLVQSRDGERDAELVPVDVGRLTARQREVLETAHREGYFQYPRGANASEVAEKLGIEPSTFTEHLAAAQSKLLDELLPRGENGQ